MCINLCLFITACGFAQTNGHAKADLGRTPQFISTGSNTEISCVLKSRPCIIMGDSIHHVFVPLLVVNGEQLCEDIKQHQQLFYDEIGRASASSSWPLKKRKYVPTQQDIEETRVLILQHMRTFVASRKPRGKIHEFVFDEFVPGDKLTYEWIQNHRSTNENLFVEQPRVSGCNDIHLKTKTQVEPTDAAAASFGP